jgi:hypothetical protein
MSAMLRLGLLVFCICLGIAPGSNSIPSHSSRGKAMAMGGLNTDGRPFIDEVRRAMRAVYSGD